MRHPEANPAFEADAPGGVPPASIAAVANALLAAADMPTLAALLVEYLGAVPGCDEVALQWWVNGPRERGQFPDRELDAAGLALAEVAFATPSVATRSSDGRRFALAIPTGDPQAAAFLLGSGSCKADELFPPLLHACVTAALEKARLRDSVERLVQADKLQDALFSIADMASSGLEMSEMLAWLHEIVGSFMYAENFYIALYDDREEMVRFHYVADLRDDSWDDISRRDIPLREIEGSLTWYLIRDAHPLMGSSEQLRRQVSGPLRDVGTDSYDWLGVPMISGGKVRGVMVVQSYVERPRFTAKDQALLSFVSNHVLTALDRKQAHEDLEQRVAQRTMELTIEVQERQRSEQLQATLFRLAKLSHTAMGLGEFYSSVHRIVGDLLDNRNFYIALLSEDGSELDFPYFVDEMHSRPPQRKLGRGITEYVLRGGQPLLVDKSNAESLAEIRRLIDAGEIAGDDASTVSWLGVPLVCSGRVVGVLAMQSYTSGNYYLPRDQHLLTFISYQIATGLERQLSAASLAMAYVNLEYRVVERTRELSEQIAEREKIEQQLKHEVLHDSLTGLPNRAYLRDQLVRTTERQRRDPSRKFAIMFIDLDRFKVINDSEGHSVGDALLKEVAVRMTACMRTSDMVARLGGDEFALLLDDISGTEDALFVAHRITERLREPVYVDGKELFTAASIGIAVSSERYQTAEELLRDADIAMYRAKANQQRRFEMFDEALHMEALQLLDLESDLRRAVTRHEFEPYFQPIIRLADHAVVGYEALMRWNHPSRGVLAPGAFLAVAEANGSLEEIDWLLFQAVFAVASRLLQPGQYVNLNLSPRHFRSPDLDTRLLALLDAAGVAPSQVRLELTEGALIDKPEQASEMIDRLRRAGILAALDDFGTGYSSLSYLHRFRLHTVKIDRSFVVDLVPGVVSGGSAVVRAILALALALELDVVAEGIETTEQREALLALGCTLGQGYLFARPQPLAALLASRETG